MLSAFILGIAGGLAIRRRIDTSSDPLRLPGWVQLAMGIGGAGDAAGVRARVSS